MAWRPCCCDCPSWSDNFNRADSDALGDGWDEESGDWTTADTEAHEAGTDGAQAIFKQHFGTTTIHASVVIDNEQEDGVYRLIVNWHNAQNYMFAQYDVAAEEIRLYWVISGVEELLELAEIMGLPPTPDKRRTFSACLGPENFTAHVSGAILSLAWVDQGPVHALGYRAGLGNGSTVAVEYDDFQIREHIHTNPKCSGCLCDCDSNEWPVDLHATLTGSGKVALLDDAPVDFIFQYDRTAAAWKADFTVVGADSAWTQEWHLAISCVAHVADAMIYWKQYNHGCSSSGIDWQLYEGSTCSPLYLVFWLHVPAYFLSCPPLAPTGYDGDFFIYITE